ncbi:MAG: hypothetical protein JRJ27_13340, partial [Deltaproteobacteria bacterium]|nr:hypothetical protein [Deltaproteobacteria bacterium]
MYEFVTGPMAWISFLIFFIGLFVRFVLYVKGLDWKADRVTYRVNTIYGIKGAVRSIFFWLIPFGTRSWRNNIAFTMAFFVFHAGLLITPIFLQAHNIILKERWGVSFFTLPDALADLMTIGVILSAVFIILRRIALPEVRILTSVYDFLILAIAVSPFITGFLAYHEAP